jgi:hypothetical protein
MEIRATLELHGKTATGITIPPEVVEGLGSGKRPAVVVTINGYSYRSTVAPYNGAYLLPVSAENRAGAGASAGDLLTVRLELDKAPREVDVPADLAAALATEPAARAFYESLSNSNQRGYTTWIEDAKKQETRDARVAKAVESLKAGRQTH